jgi:hypothetical protein
MLVTTKMPLSPATEQSFFGVLFRCVLVSGALMLVATVLKWEPLVTMAVGIAPLIWYHIFYLAKRAKLGLGQTAIDSVYYFGFLITIAALGLSAITLAYSAGATSLTHVAFQFGLGLLATGYAVVARMHLNSISTYVDDASPENVLDRYVHRSRELVTNVEMASTQFVELSNSLMVKSQEVADTARQSTEKVMLEMARAFDEELRGTLASARAGLTEIRGLVSETSFAHEREALARSIRETIDVVTTLNRALVELSERSIEGASATEQSVQSSAAFSRTLETFRASLNRIGGEDGELVASADALSRAQATIVDGAESLGQAVHGLDSIAGTVGSMGLTFKGIKSLTQKANEQLEALVTTAGQLENASQRLERSALGTDSLVSSLERFATAMPAVAERSTGLNASLDQLARTVVGLHEELSTIPAPTRETIQLSLQLRQAIEGIQQSLHESTLHGGRLVSQANAQALALEKAAELANQANGMAGAGDSIRRTLSQLEETVTKLHGTLGTSTTALHSAISAATQSLESDVKRSTDAARQFGDRLTNVAQILIDHTQARPS